MDERSEPTLTPCLKSVLADAQQQFEKLFSRYRDPNETVLYFGLFGIQKSLLNWSSHCVSCNDALGAGEAALLASRVSYLKQAVLPLLTPAPNGARDYWDRLFSLSVNDDPCVTALGLRLPDHAREGNSYFSRLNRILDAILDEGPIAADTSDDFRMMKPLYGGTLRALAGVLRQDAAMTVEGLELMLDRDTPTRGLAWLGERSHYCPAVTGIIRLAQTRIGDAFAFSPFRSLPLDMSGVTAGEVLYHLDGIASGFAHAAAAFPATLSKRDIMRLGME